MTKGVKPTCTSPRFTPLVANIAGPEDEEEAFEDVHVADFERYR